MHYDVAASSTQPLVLRGGEGIAIQAITNLPLNTLFKFTIAFYTDEGYSYMAMEDFTPMDMGPVLILMNGSGSGRVIYITSIEIQETGENGQYDLYTLDRYEQKWTNPGDPMQILKLDTNNADLPASITVEENPRLDWIGKSIGGYMMQPFYKRVLNPIPYFAPGTAHPVGCGGGYCRAKVTNYPVNTSTITPVILRPGQGFGVRRQNTSERCPAEIVVTFTVENEPIVGTYPAEGDVDNTAADYGPTGTEYTGTFAVPAVGNVVDGVFYGAAGTEFEGTYVGGGSAVYPVIGGSHVIQSEGGEDG
jgi:hypothetical protein